MQVLQTRPYGPDTVLFEGTVQACEAFIAMMDTLTRADEAQFVAAVFMRNALVGEMGIMTLPQLVAYIKQQNASDYGAGVAYAWDIFTNLQRFEADSIVVLDKGDPELYAGMSVPTTHYIWNVNGHEVKVVTYPDWDNYAEDITIWVDSVVVATYEN